jgi:hypothetical protein
MALYVPAGARRKRLVLVGGLALLAGLLIGYAVGRATSPGLEDEVADVHDVALDATAALRRIPIEYEQAVAGEGGESTETITEAIDRAEQLLDDAYAEAIWLADDAHEATDPAFDELRQLVEDEVPPAEFDAAIETLVAQVATTFAVEP